MPTDGSSHKAEAVDRGRERAKVLAAHKKTLAHSPLSETSLLPFYGSTTERRQGPEREGNVGESSSFSIDFKTHQDANDHKLPSELKSNKKSTMACVNRQYVGKACNF